MHQLVVGDYAALADGTALHDSLEQYREAVIANGWSPDLRLVDMPREAFIDQGIYPITDDAAAWHIDLYLWWSDPAFPGDLTLQAYVEETAEGVTVLIQDLHVL